MTIKEYDHIAYTDADGRSWVQKLPDRVRRELLAERAVDALSSRLAASSTIIDAASKAATTASAETPPAELIGAWSRQNAELIGLMADLINDASEAVSAMRRMLYQE